MCSLLGCGWIPDYSHGITLATPLAGSEKKQVLHFCALGSDEMQKFVEDLKESIAEVTELEQIRIECKDGPPVPEADRWGPSASWELPCLACPSLSPLPPLGLPTPLQHPIPMWGCITIKLSPTSPSVHMCMHVCQSCGVHKGLSHLEHCCIGQNSQGSRGRCP